MTWPCWVFPSLSSTMDKAKEFVKENKTLNDVFVVATYEQTAGRGRNGSKWESPVTAPNTEKAPVERGASAFRQVPFVQAMGQAGTLLPLTLAIPSHVLKVPLNWLSVAVGCALYDALGKWCEQFRLLGLLDRPVSPLLHLKWPNDIVYWSKKKKIAGILCETAVQDGQFKWVYVGVGLNLWEAPADIPQAGALVPMLLETLNNGASNHLQRTLKKWQANLENPSEREKLTESFAFFFYEEVNSYLKGLRTQDQLQALALERMFPLGTPISVNKGLHKGVFAGLDSQGGLLLNIEGQLQSFVSADVTLSEDPTLGLKPMTSLLDTTKGQLRGGVPQTHQAPKDPHLLIDIGNTRAHMLIVSSLSSSKSLGEFHISRDQVNPSKGHTVPEPFRALCDTLRRLRVTPSLKIVYVSVATAQSTRTLISVLEEAIHLALPGVSIHSQELFSSTLLKENKILFDRLVDNYRGKLGPDRALRFLRAQHIALERKETVGVFSFGTALTAEVVNSEGCPIFSGIAPGINMALKALSQGELLKEFTQAHVQEGGHWTHSLPTGWGTEASIAEGVFGMTLGFIQRLIEKHSISYGIFCGGSLPIFSGHLAFRIPFQLENNLELLELQRCLRSTKTQTPDIFGGPLGTSPLERRWAPSTPAQLSPDSITKSVESFFDPKSHMARILKSLERRRRIRKGDTLDQKPLIENFRRLGQPLGSPQIGPRLDRFLAHKYRFHSRVVWLQRIEQGEVLIQRNAAFQPQSADKPPGSEVLLTVKPTYRLRVNDQIWIHKPPEEEPGFLPQVDPLYDDGDIVVFNKPGNSVIHAVGMYGKNTFLDQIHRNYPATYPVHRIDRETSGILLCARSSATRRRLTGDFKENRIDKMYLTIVKGPTPEKPLWHILNPIGPAQGSKIRLKLWVDTPGAVSAHTIVHHISSYNNYHLLACVPVTGRTNQIRVHLASQGLWVVGDKMYCEDESVFLDFYNNGVTPFVLKSVETPRHLLHNAAIGWPDVVQGAESQVSVCSTLPPDMLEFPMASKLLEKVNIPLDPHSQVESFMKIFHYLTAIKNLNPNEF